MEKKIELRIYLDLNVLQFLYENEISFNTDGNIVYVYSDEHFKEFSKYQDPRFFSILKTLKARKLEIGLDKESKIIDEANLLFFEEPEKLYNVKREFYENISDFEELMTSVLSLYYGNKKALDLKETKNRIKEAMSLPFESIEENLGDLIPDQLIDEYNRNMELVSSMFQSAINEIGRKIQPIEKTRKSFTNHQLSNLSSDDGPIISQIWELIKEGFPGVNREQVFGIASIEDRDKPMSKYLAVIKCYTMLNLLGFNPDKGLTKKNRVGSSQHDAAHVANAIFCNLLMSADERLCRKAVVIYDFLNLKVQVVQLKYSGSAMSYIYHIPRRES